MPLIPSDETGPWDETMPPGAFEDLPTSSESLGDDFIRQLKRQIFEILSRAHHMGEKGQGEHWGAHKFWYGLEAQLPDNGDADGDIAFTIDTLGLWQWQTDTWVLIAGGGLASFLKGTRANQPAAAYEGRLYWISDEGRVERDNGEAWEHVFFVDDPAGDRSLTYEDHFWAAVCHSVMIGETTHWISDRYKCRRTGSGVFTFFSTGGVISGFPANGVVQFNVYGSDALWFETRAKVASVPKNPLLEFRFRCAPQADIEFSVGIAADWTAVPHGDDGIYLLFQTLESPETLKVICKSGANTSEQALTIPGTDWHVIRLVVRGGTSVDVYMDDMTMPVGTISTNLPSGNLSFGGSFFNAAQAGVGMQGFLQIDYALVSCDTL